MISDHSITDLTFVGRNSIRCGYGTVNHSLHSTRSRALLSFVSPGNREKEGLVRASHSPIATTCTDKSRSQLFDSSA